jgi:hypothetical protein
MYAIWTFHYLPYIPYFPYTPYFPKAGRARTKQGTSISQSTKCRPLVVHARGFASAFKAQISNKIQILKTQNYFIKIMS